MPLRRTGPLCLSACLLAAAALAPLPAAAAQPRSQSPAAKAAEPACIRCHEAQARAQPETMMGRALALPGNNPVLDAHPSLTVEKGAYTYTVETRGGRSTYSVTDGTSTLTVPIAWSFGAGNQTWVLERDGQLYESLVSYYASIDALDTTTGDDSIAPATLEQAFGRPLDPIDARACFGCHTTGSTVDGRLVTGALHPGIACTRCHAGSLEHQASMASGELTAYPPDLARLSAEELSSFCGQCHRTWEMVVRSHWRGEANVRFQPYRLANSRCFDGSDPRISCLACHDPHQPLVHTLSYYDAKCLACHTAAAHPAPAHSARAAASAGAGRQPGSCPVASSRCVTCHMPKTRMLGGHLVFTDHDIRIVHPGDGYPD
jgi:hypothetical protein